VVPFPLVVIQKDESFDSESGELRCMHREVRASDSKFYSQNSPRKDSCQCASKVLGHYGPHRQMRQQHQQMPKSMSQHAQMFRRGIHFIWPRSLVTLLRPTRWRPERHPPRIESLAFFMPFRLPRHSYPIAYSKCIWHASAVRCCGLAALCWLPAGS